MDIETTAEDKMAGRPTLKDVAEVARVSEMTASRVLRGMGEASAHTIERVQKAATSLGYVPNRIAGALSSKTVPLVGVVVPSISSFVFSEVLTGISAALKGSPLQPVFGISEYDLDTEEAVIREMLSWRPSGLIVAGLEHTENARILMKSAGVPVVEIMDVDGDPVDMNVGISHHKAGYDMAREILQRGYSKIGFIGTKMPHDFRAQKRLNGFQQALAEADITLADTEYYSDGSSMLVGRALTEQMLARSGDLQCIYYSSDMLSCGGLMHCVKAGISVPGDLALAGFNGLDLRKAMPWVPATSDAHRFDIGRKSAELVLANLAGKRSEQRRVEYTAEITLGDTL